MLTLITTAYFQTFVESLTNGVVILNAAGEVYVVNAAAAGMLGCAREHLLGMNAQQAFQGLEKMTALQDILRAAQEKNGHAAMVQSRYVGPDGRTLHLNLSSSVLVDHDKVFGILVSLVDVTDIVAMHEREKTMLQEKNLLQRERFEGMFNLSRAVAHQIRNPVMTIGGFANLLLRKNSCEHEHLEAIVSAGRRLEDIVRAVADYTGLATAELRPVSVRALLDQCLADLQSRWTAQAPGLETQVQDADLLVDARLFCLALLEVLVNSLEAAGPAARVTVQGTAEAGRYRLAVQDNGPGFAPEVLPYAADPFFTTKAVGVGMGLCKVARIVAEHRGRLTLANQPQGGAQVVLDLPLAPESKAH